MGSCTHKGDVSGEITVTIKSPALFHEPDKIIKPKNKNIYILAYDKNLFLEQEKLVSECRQQHNVLFQQYSKLFAQALADRLSGEAMKLLVDPELEKDYRLTIECTKKRYNRFFSQIKATTTDEKGSFSFKEIPYGQYYLAFDWRDYWWLEPFELKASSLRIDLNEQNATAFGTFSH